MPEGIWPPAIAFYMQCIRFHCEAAMLSIDFLAEFASMTNEAEGNYEIGGELQDAILNHLQNIFVHAAAISRYAWPSKAGKENLHANRGLELKRLLDLSDESPLRDRNLRNKLEHFDENLDIYLNSKPIVGHVIPAYVGGSINSQGVPVHLFRAFYVDTAIFEILGHKFEAQPIVDEICRLHRRFHAGAI